LSLIDVFKAYRNIREYVAWTPLMYSYKLSRIANCNVYLKLENIQVTGSFKVRGACNAVKSLSREELERGIITASSGNHGIGLAYISSKLGVKSIIVMPKNTSKWKIELCKAFGGEVVLAGDNYDEAEEYCFKIARENDLTYISSYADLKVIAGQATIAHEIFMDNPDINTILVPIGGGGLISGVAFYAKTVNPKVKIIGVQTDKARTMYESFKAKRVVEVPYEPCLAEALAGKISELTLKFTLKYVDDIILVEDEKLMEAVLWTLKNEHQVVEPSGVVGIAAILQRKMKFNRNENVAIIVSGGNMDIRKIVK